MKNKVLAYIILLAMSYLTITYYYDFLTNFKAQGVYYCIRPINTSLSQGSFDTEVIEMLRGEPAYSQMAISYAYREEVTIQGMGKEKKAIAIQTNSDYKVVYGLAMQTGNFFNESNCNSESVVLNENLAFQLFGDSHIIGEEVKVNGRRFKILGIAKEQYKNEGAIVYIRDSVEEEKESVYVKEIGIYSYINQRLVNYEKIEQILQKLDKVKDEYRIIEEAPLFDRRKYFSYN